MRTLAILGSRRSTHSVLLGSLLFAFMTLLGVGAAQAQQSHLIRLRYATFDPLKGVPPVAPELRTVPARLDEVGHYLVQCQGPILPEWVLSLRRAGVVIEDYIPDYTFVVKATARQAAALPGSLRFVRWTGVFHAAYKIDPATLAGPAPLVAQTFTPTDRAALTRRLQAYGAGLLNAGRNRIEVNGSPQLAVQLARTVEVKWVQPKVQMRLSNDVGAGIMGVGGATGVRTRRLYGAGQIVGVCDTGCDTGDPATINPDFAGRIVQGDGLAVPGDWSDVGAHGTHVAGSVLGSGANSGSNPGQHIYDNSFAGVAPEARLYVQGLKQDPVLGYLLGFPPSLYDLFVAPYAAGARVHTNSWGGAAGGAYTSWESEADQFVHDNDDLVVLFSAGNDGVDVNLDGVVDLGSMGSPAAAKNVITVGASENYRPPNSGWGGAADFPWGMYPPFDNDYISDNIQGMAMFSSRGPCADGRIKPDVVAPGTNIVSVWSAPAATAGQIGWGEFAGAYSATNPLSQYIYMGGTSMATPLTAGAAALVREYYMTRSNWLPSAALVKATLINGAFDMAPGQYGTGAYREMGPRPNNVEGFGRVDLTRSLFPATPRKVTWVDRPTGLQTGGTYRMTYAVRNPSEPLSVTLVWTDPAGSPAAAAALVNDLDLTIMNPSGQVFFANGRTGLDRLNNVENIDIASPTAGSYIITVAATNVPIGPQTFALVVSGDGGPAGGRLPDITPPVVKILQPAAGDTVGGTVTVQVQAADDRGLDRVALQLDNGVFLGTRYGAPFTFTWNTKGFTPGQHALSAVAYDTSRNTAKDTITITLR